jgi:DNA (cytosine-5)-methyltransferase 1
MSTPVAIDLFCGAGGATKGLQRAGFYVIGVDINPQPRYCGDEFIQGDALEQASLLVRADFVWASPPCQAYSQLSVRYEGLGGARDRRAELINPTRATLKGIGVPFVIENVNGARRVLRSPARLTGEMFGLRVHRPRWFEATFPLIAPRAPRKQPNPVAVYGKMDGRRLWTRTDGSELRAPRSLAEPAAAMGIDWMEWGELCEAIPPAYSEFIGCAALQHLQSERAAA